MTDLFLKFCCLIVGYSILWGIAYYARQAKEFNPSKLSWWVCSILMVVGANIIHHTINYFN